jgi:CubicO group peptidase (beta-lactamase class C family)
VTLPATVAQTSRPAASIEGFTAPGFEPVREAFARNFAEHGEVGAAVCVYRRGIPVVDLWGGLADPVTRRPWQRDARAVVFSTTKGITAALLNRLLERGTLELEAPVARYWPEFAAKGKGGIRVLDVLTHSAGLAAVDGELTLAEVLAWHPVCAAIAAQEPNWPPGTAHGYHARSYGWILGEIVRRATGSTLGQLFREEFGEPLGLDFWIGLPSEYEPSVARMLPAPESPDPRARELREKFMGPGTLLGRVISGPSNLFAYDDMWNRRELHAAEMPSSNGIGSARALARCYAAMIGEVDGRRLLRPETLARATEVRVDGPDRVLLMPTRFGLGFMLAPLLGEGAPATAFGHAGAGGSLAFADPVSGIAFGYVMNQMQLGLVADERASGLVRAAFAARSD